MPQALRIQYPSAIYHITSRGNNRQAIFRDRDDRLVFLEIIGRADPRFNLEIFAFCLIDNLYHLFIRTPDANLSRAIHWINYVYARYYRLKKT